MKQNIKFFSGLCAVIILVINAFAFTVLSAPANDITCNNGDKAYAIYLYNSTSGRPLFEQNIDKSISPASTVKLMTALVAFDGIKDPEAKITVTADMIKDVEGNRLGLSEGEMISYRSLLIALVCGGYNDAAIALATADSGSVSQFVNKMNEKARKLGAINTTYTEPTGIDDSAKTTAEDTMLIAREFMKNSALLEYSSLPSYKIPQTNKSEERLIYNRNALKSSYTTVKYLNPSAIGMNAGMTSGGGYCVVTGVKNGSEEYICIVMGAKHGADTDTTYSYSIANELIAQITRLGDRLILSSRDTVNEISIEGAALGKDKIALRPKSDVIAYLPADYESTGLLDISYIFTYETLVAPIREGDAVGKITVSYDGDIVAVTDLVAAESVEREFIIYALYVIKKFLVSRKLLLILISLVVILIARLIISDRERRKKSRYVGRRY